MGNEFGEGVSTLLNTYAQCLSLLKALTKASRHDASLSATGAGSVLSLRRSVRSDRSRVHNAYRSRLYRDGSRLSRGDATARSALRRIVNKLRTAIRSVLRLARAPSPDEYGSLTALSNTTRIDAIKTMEDLSRRLNTKTSSITTTSKTSSSNSSSKVNNRHATKKPKKKKTAQTNKRAAKSGNKSDGKTTSHKRRARTSSPAGKEHVGKKGSDPGYKKPEHQHQPNPPPHASGPRKVTKTKNKKGKPAAAAAAAGPSTPNSAITEHTAATVAAEPNHNRISFLSTSTDSTKLGEIPYRPRLGPEGGGRRLQRRRPQLPPNATDDDLENVIGEVGEEQEYYEIRPAYPLYAYHTLEMQKQEKKKKKGGLLRRIFGKGVQEEEEEGEEAGMKVV